MGADGHAASAAMASFLPGARPSIGSASSFLDMPAEPHLVLTTGSGSGLAASRSAAAHAWFDSSSHHGPSVATSFGGHHEGAASGEEALANAKSSLKVCMMGLLAASAAWLSAYVNYSIESEHLEHEKHEAIHAMHERDEDDKDNSPTAGNAGEEHR